MNILGPRLSFVVRFAWRDLADLRTRTSTLVLVGSIALVTALTLVSLAIPRAAEIAQQRALALQPGATSLAAWNPGGFLSEQLTASGLRTLRDNILRGTADRPEALIAFAPYRTVGYGFANGDRRGITTQMRGRTIRWPEDPLLATWGLPAEEMFRGPDDLGIVVTPRFLARLNLAADLPAGSKLDLLTRAGSTIPVEVRGRLTANLPSGATFVLTEAGCDDLDNREPDISLGSAVSGPLPHGWPSKPRNLSPVAQQKIQARCSASRVGFPQTHEDWSGGEPVAVWKFDALPDSTAPRRSSWHNLLLNLHGDLVEIGLPASAGPNSDPEFARVPMPRDYKPTTAPASDPDTVGIYMARLEDLAPAARAVEESGYQCDDGIIRQLAAYADSAAIAGAIMRWILGAVWLVALLNLGSLQALRLQQKRAEIGMMRAMGAGDGTLLRIGTCQAAMLWVIGSLLGAIFAALTLFVLVPTLLPGAAAGDILDPKWRRESVGFVVLSLLGCVAFTWLGGGGARRTSPAEALTSN